MTTVAEIINQALKDASVIGEGETASAETMQDAFTTLNQMLGMWQADNLTVYAQQEISFDVTGATTYTIGEGAAVNTQRPILIQAAFYRLNGVDETFQMLYDFTVFQSLTTKSLAGYPCAMFYQPTYPYGTIHVYPQPSIGSIHLTLLVDLPEYTATANNLSLPRTYEMAVRSNLAVLLSATFDTPLKPGVAMLAQKSLKLIKRNNVRIPELGMPVELLHPYFNVITGGWPY